MSRYVAIQPYLPSESHVPCVSEILHTVAPDPRRLEPGDNARAQEENCYMVAHDKKYYEFFDSAGQSQTYIKRSLTPSEYLVNRAGRLVLPKKPKERLMNEVAAIRYVQRHTNIPTPNIRCAFEDHGRYYIITDTVPGVAMVGLSEDQKAIVEKELEGYIKEMHSITSKTMGGTSGDICLPHRLENAISHEDLAGLKFRDADTPKFVFCHNDLSQYNVIVDETTLKVNAIIDWEYAGFYPPEFDWPFYTRKGPSGAIGNEEDDVPKLLAIVDEWRVV